MISYRILKNGFCNIELHSPINPIIKPYWLSKASLKNQSYFVYFLQDGQCVVSSCVLNSFLMLVGFFVTDEKGEIVDFLQKDHQLRFKEQILSEWNDYEKTKEDIE